MSSSSSAMSSSSTAMSIDEKTPTLNKLVLDETYRVL